MEIGEKIREVIAWSPYQEWDIASAIGVSKSTMSGYINGTAEIPLSRLKRIADFMDVSLWVFLNQEALPAASMDLTEQESLLVTEYRRLKRDQQTKIYELMKTM